MSLRTQIVHGVRSLFRRAPSDHDLADEVEHYLAEATAAYRQQGLSDADAHRAARLDLGSRTSVQQQVRASRWETVVEALVVDLRRAARRLRRTPGFAAVTVISLALGIGASTAIFSVVRPVLLEPLPYPDGDRVVVMTDTDSDGAACLEEVRSRDVHPPARAAPARRGYRGRAPGQLRHARPDRGDRRRRRTTAKQRQRRRRRRLLVHVHRQGRR